MQYSRFYEALLRGGSSKDKNEMDKENVSFEIPKELINPLIQEKIKITLLESLGDRDKLMNELVSFVLNQKVDSKGLHTGNSYDDKFSLIDVMLRKHTVDAIKETISQLLAEKKGVIKQELVKQLSTKKAAELLASSLLNATSGAMQSSWKLNVTANFDELKTNY